MIAKLAAAAAVALCTLSVPAAHAATAAYRCGWDTFAQETLTGGEDSFTGVLFAYAVFDDRDAHPLRCYVRIDGQEQASTPTRSGAVVVATAGPVAYTAGWDSTVELCTEIDGATVGCGDDLPGSVLVDQVLDGVQSVVDAVLDRVPHAAHADLVRAGCSFDPVTTSTSGTVTVGVVYGYAYFDDQATHSLTCVSLAGPYETPTGIGTTFVTTSGQMPYDWDGVPVVLCAVVDGVTVTCGP
jgi:hypothetical protein